MSEHATVTLKAPDGSEHVSDLRPDDYVISLGPQRYIAAEQVYANGTVVVTIKLAREAGDGDE